MKKELTKLTELKKQTPAQLRAEANKLRAELFQIQMQISLQKEKDTSKLKKIKKNIARVCTILQEKVYEQ